MHFQLFFVRVFFSNCSFFFDFSFVLNLDFINKIKPLDNLVVVSFFANKTEIKAMSRPTSFLSEQKIHRENYR